MIKAGRVHSNFLPKEIHDFTTEYGGLNLFGDPLFRIVWSGNRMEWKTAKFTDKNEFGEMVRQEYASRYIRKYRIAKDQEKWIIERWRPSMFYGSPSEWFAARLICDARYFVMPKGDYPSRGDYERVDTVEWINDHGEAVYAEPTRAYITYVIDAVRVMDKLTSDQNEQNVLDENQRQTDISINNLLDKMKQNNRPFIGPTAWMRGSSSGSKDNHINAPTWNERDIPHLRGKVSGVASDKWALEMPEDYLTR